MSSDIYSGFTTHQCLICQTSYQRSKTSNKRYCSETCRRSALSIAKKARFVPVWSTCNNCNHQFIGKSRKFCSKSCSATYNNTGRTRSDESRQRTAITLKSKFSSPTYTPKTPKVVKEVNYQCTVCSSSFLSTSKKHKKTCSKACYLVLARHNRIRYLKDNAGTFNWIQKGKMNYFETQFDLWLQSIGYVQGQDYLPLSYVIHNPEKSTSYIMDFWFPSLNLNIELDGSHHDLDPQRVRDQVRDEFLNRVHKITVIRIKGRMWNKRLCRESIKSDLHNGALKRS